MKLCNLVSNLSLLSCLLFGCSELVQAKRIGEKVAETKKNERRGLQTVFDLFKFRIAVGATPDFETSFHLWACFSSHSTAEVKGRGKVRMSEIEVGDQVLTEKGNYETIYSIDHRHPTKSADFLQIHYESMKKEQQKPLEITHKHMIFVDGNSNPVPAHTVKVGDMVKTLNGPREVTKIKTITRKGLYNPLTTDGTIVTNGIISSVYSAYLSSDEWIEIAGHKVMTHEAFFHNVLKPYRYICTGVSLELCKTSNEKVAISHFAAEAHQYWLQMNETNQAVLLSFVIVLVHLIDLLSSLYGLTFVAASVSWFMFKRRSESTKKVKTV